MSDFELRAAERCRNESPARYLKARLRAGTLTRDQLALAAGANYAPAIELLEQSRALPKTATEWHPEHRFRKFLGTLTDLAALTAAIAAARAVQIVTCFEHNPDCTRTRCVPIRAVIDAATRYRDNPTPANQKAWDDACAALGDGLTLWLPVPHAAPKLYTHETVGTVWEAIREAGFTPVCREVRRQLVEWALRDVPGAHTASRSDVLA